MAGSSSDLCVHTPGPRNHGWTQNERGEKMSFAFAHTHTTARISSGLLFAVCEFAAAGDMPFAQNGWAPNTLGIEQASQIEPALKRVFDTSFLIYVKAGAGRRKVTIDTCLTWLTWRGKVVGAEPQSDFVALLGQGLECDALALLRSAKPARRTALPADLATISDTRLYPATLWIAASDEGVARLSRPGLTLSAASGMRQWTPDRNGLLLADETGGVRLVWLARADFDGDGWEDGLFRWQAWIRGGTWSDMRLVVLTRRSPSASLTDVAPALGLTTR